jgi:hypothetical protein
MCTWDENYSKHEQTQLCNSSRTPPKYQQDLKNSRSSCFPNCFHLFVFFVLVFAFRRFSSVSSFLSSSQRIERGFLFLLSLLESLDTYHLRRRAIWTHLERNGWVEVSEAIVYVWETILAKYTEGEREKEEG